MPRIPAGQAPAGLPIARTVEEPAVPKVPDRWQRDPVRRVLIHVLDRLVDAGHTVVVIEHHLDVIKRADWVIDMGPEGGSSGGEIVGSGTPEQIAANPRSPAGVPLLRRLARFQQTHLVEVLDEVRIHQPR